MPLLIFSPAITWSDLRSRVPSLRLLSIGLVIHDRTEHDVNSNQTRFNPTVRQILGRTLCTKVYWSMEGSTVDWVSQTWDRNWIEPVPETFHGFSPCSILVAHLISSDISITSEDLPCMATNHRCPDSIHLLGTSSILKALKTLRSENHLTFAFLKLRSRSDHPDLIGEMNCACVFLPHSKFQTSNFGPWTSRPLSHETEIILLLLFLYTHASHKVT